MLWLYQYFYGDVQVESTPHLCPPLMTDEEPYVSKSCEGSPPLSSVEDLTIIDDYGDDVVDDSGNTIVEDSYIA